MHAFNPSTQEAEVGGSLNSRSAWSVHEISDQQRLHSKTPSQTNKTKPKWCPMLVISMAGGDWDRPVSGAHGRPYPKKKGGWNLRNDTLGWPLTSDQYVHTHWHGFTPWCYSLAWKQIFTRYHFCCHLKTICYYHLLDLLHPCIYHRLFYSERKSDCAKTEV